MTAVRTGCGKSQTSRQVGQILLDAGSRSRSCVIRCPTATSRRCACSASRRSRISTLATRRSRSARSTSRPSSMGMVMYAGVDYARHPRARPQAEADVIVWDGGNNDFPFYRARPAGSRSSTRCEPAHELSYHPGETNLRLRRRRRGQQDRQRAPEPRSTRPRGRRVGQPARDRHPGRVAGDARRRARRSRGKRVLVVEDGPTLTHGGMSFGAGTVAARQGGAAELVDPRPCAVGSIADDARPVSRRSAPCCPRWATTTLQLRELEETIDAADCDVVVTGTPFDLGRADHDPASAPPRDATSCASSGEPTLAERARADRSPRPAPAIAG